MRSRLRLDPMAWRSWSASPGREAGHVDGHLHQLLLEQGDPQGLGQARLQQRVQVGDRLLAVAPADVGVHRPALDGPGSDEGHLHHQVVEGAGLEAGQRGHLGPALDLEHPDRVGPAQHVVDLVLLGDVGQVDLHAVGVADQVDGVVQGAEHAQAQQVELDQAHRRAVVLVPLQDGAVLHAGPLHRAHLDHRPVAQHHAARVDAQVAGEVLDLAGQLEHRPRGCRDRSGDRALATGAQASTCLDQASCWPVA